MSTIIGTPYQGTHTLGNWESDNAYDIGTPVGTPMVAAADGVVVRVTKHAQDGTRFAGDGITIRTTDGNELFYKHGVAAVKTGQRVKQGDVLGTTGSANGSPHLHFAALHDPKGFLDGVVGGGSSLLGKVGGVVGKLPIVGDAVTGGSVIGGAAGDAVGGAAGDVAKATVGALWDAVGADGARALLYALLVFGGVALAVAGVARATGVGQKLKTVATTAAAVTPAGRGAKLAGAL